MDGDVYALCLGAIDASLGVDFEQTIAAVGGGPVRKAALGPRAPLRLNIPPWRTDPGNHAIAHSGEVDWVDPLVGFESDRC